MWSALIFRWAFALLAILVISDLGLMMPTAPHGISGSTRTDHDTATATSPELVKRYGGELGPAWFYKRTMTIRCGSPSSVYNQDPKAVDYPGVGYWQFPLWKSDAFTGREDAFKAIRSNKRGPGVRHSYCPSKFHADRCVAVYHCFCYVKLIQPTPTATGVSLADYQKILDSIPPAIKLQHKYYKWFHGLGEHGDSLTFSKDQPPFSNAETRVSWTKEPYKIQGPDGGSGSSWGSLADIVAAYGSGGLGAAGSFWRRNWEQSTTDADSQRMYKPTNQTLNGIDPVMP